jgi:hypothetical protein
LLNHERELLMDYLEALGVKHRAGETDESFLFSHPPEKLREEASHLLDKHPQKVALAYLAYIAHQQKSNVFEDWPPLLEYGASDAAPTQGAGVES